MVKENQDLLLNISLETFLKTPCGKNSANMVKVEPWELMNKNRRRWEGSSTRWNISKT
jgi:hypothetical protein